MHESGEKRAEVRVSEWVSEWTVFSKRGLVGGGSAGPARAVRPTPGHRSPLSLYCVCRSHSLPRVTPGHSDIEFYPAQSRGRQDGRMNAPTWKKGECMKMRDWWSGGLMEAITEDKEVAGVGGSGSCSVGWVALSASIEEETWNLTASFFTLWATLLGTNLHYTG